MDWIDGALHGPKGCDKSERHAVVSMTDQPAHRAEVF
jgi:hypothetical protein